jgi:hypothetical protein
MTVDDVLAGFTGISYRPRLHDTTTGDSRGELAQLPLS